MTGAGLASTGGGAAAAGSAAAGLTCTAADCCGVAAGAGLAATGSSDAGLEGAAFGTGIEDGVRLAIFGAAGGWASRRVIGSSGPDDGRGGGAP